MLSRKRPKQDQRLETGNSEQAGERGRGYQRGQRGAIAARQRQVSDAAHRMANAAITPTQLHIL